MSCLLHYYELNPENRTFIQNHKTPLAVSDNPQRVLNPLTRNLYATVHTCNHVFIDLHFSFKSPCFYCAGHDFSVSSPFDVLPCYYFYSDITMT